MIKVKERKFRRYDLDKLAIIFHPKIYIGGGGSYVAKLFYKYFKEKDIVTTIIARDPHTCSKDLQTCIEIKHLIAQFPNINMLFLVRISGGYLTDNLVQAIKRELLKDINIIAINYIHFPYEASVAGLERVDTLEGILIDSMRRIFFKREKLSVNLDNFNNVIMLANSYFTKIVTKIVLNIEPIVLYPTLMDKFVRPLRYEYFTRKDRRMIVSLGVYTPGKRYHFIPAMSKFLNGYKVYVIGFSNSIFSRAYKMMIKTLLKLYRVKNVKLLTNTSEKIKELYLKKAMFMLHLRFFEHFGIAILEAIKYGTIPIIHASGGQQEICRLTKYGLLYKGNSLKSFITEIVRLLSLIDTYSLEDMYQQYTSAINNINKYFTYTVFKQKLNMILRQPLNNSKS